MSRGDQYRSVYEESLTDPTGFWRSAAESITWDTPPSRILEGAHDRPRWFPDAHLNTCYNALDRHVCAGGGDRVALRYDSAMTGIRRNYSYFELVDEVARCSGALAGLGVRRGDRVVIYLPMIPEAVVAMLACARIGAVHSVVFGGFPAKELAARIDDAEPVLLLTASGGVEPGRPVPYLPIVAQALRLVHTHSIRGVLVKRRRDVTLPADTLPWSDWSGYSSTERPWLDWDEVIAGATAQPVSVAATDPLYILHTSGTTGRPKGVVRDNGGHAVALSWSMRNIYDVGAGQVMWTASDVGWVVGHSYMVYGPLLVGATTVIYEGKPVGTPDAGQFWRMIDRHRVKVLFTAPTALRTIRKVDPTGDGLADHDISTLRTMFCAGERLDPGTYRWAADLVGRPVVDHWWQTETGWPVFANPRGLEPLPIKPGSASVPVPGFRPRVLDRGGNRLPREVEGNVVLGLPLPPGTLTGLWHDDDQRYQQEYLSAYPGHYVTGDTGYFDEDGYVYILGRSDDVINVAGHRLSTGAMEAVLCAHPAVAECAVIGVSDELKGQRPRGYIVLKAGVEVGDQQLREDLVRSVRDEIGAITAFREVIVVAALPRTRSGKILRKTMRQIVAGEPYSIPATIKDPNALATFAQHLDG